MPERFKKDDFLTPSQFAKESGYNKDIVEKSMKQLLLKKATVNVETAAGTLASRPLIYNFNGTSHGKRNQNRLHPLGKDILTEYIKTNLSEKRH